MAHWALAHVRSGAPGGKQIEPSFLRRLTLDLAAPDGSRLDTKPLLEPLLQDEAAHGHAFELPSIDPRRAGRRHRFVYGAAARRPSNCWNALAKADVATGGVRVWHEPGAACWEPVFLPRPGGAAEDDGVMLPTGGRRCWFWTQGVGRRWRAR
jgi:carlactone synthase/all-trans-10'-apo-beta-carotenal 13,14-cleaving dioxygenase